MGRKPTRTSPRGWGDPPSAKLQPAVGLAVLCLACLGAAQDVARPSRITRDESPEFGHFSRTDVRLKSRPFDYLDAELDIDGVRRRLELRPHSLRSDDFQVLVQQPDGSLQTVTAPRVRTYRGTVAGVANSRVVGSLEGGRFTAQVKLGDGDIRHVTPLKPNQLRFDGDEARYAVYRELDPAAVIDDWHCGSDAQTLAQHLTAPSPGDFPVAATAMAGGGLKVAEIAFDADYEFFQKNGSSVAGTVSDIESVMNAVADLYENQLGITYEITTILVRSSEPDPYTSTNNETLLGQFRSHWNTNLSWIRRDITHLMTGKDIDGGIIGTAHIGVICEVCGGNPNGYGYSESRFTNNAGLRRCLTAHELGHNWGAVHCDGQADCDIMCSFLGTCGAGCDDFDAAAVTAMTREKNDPQPPQASCLADSVAPTSAPFCETFDLSPDAQKWTYNTFNPMNLGGDGLTSQATTAPSPPKALRLNGYVHTCGALTPGPDEIRSNVIQLAGLNSANLSYWTRFAGNPSGTFGHLIVEYRTDAQTWTQLNSIPSGGTPPTNFTFWSHPLPPAALADGFRIRFRLAMVDVNSTWWIDDVTVGAAAPATPVLYVRDNAPPGGNGGTWATAFNDLQDALAAAECSLGLVQEVWVAQGTYRPDSGTGDRAATFRVPEGITLYGGFAGTETLLEDRDVKGHETILSGEIGTPFSVTDNSYHVVTFAGGAAGIDGFTITAGNADGVSPNERGAGVYHLGVSLSEVRNCVLKENRSSRAGAAFGELGGLMRFEDGLFIDNVAAVSSGGAVGLDLNVSAEFVRTRFLGNSAGAFGGAIDANNSVFLADNCLFSGNSAGYGGAVYAFGSSGAVLSSTFASNTADAYAGLYAVFSDIAVTSSIFWSNQDGAGQTQSSQIDGSTLNLNYSLVQGWTGDLGGVGNGGTDPLFVEPLGMDTVPGTMDDDLHIAAGSAAIEAGDPDLPLDPMTRDLDGRSRLACNRIDIGAFESDLGDYDGDGNVDIDDALFSPLCSTGPNEMAATPCLAFDFDGDADVDLADLATLLDCSLQP